MFTKIAIAAAIVLGTVSGSMAMSKNPRYDVYVNGQYVGSDPDANVRSQLAHDLSQNR
jgi:hypothetical protein